MTDWLKEVKKEAVGAIGHFIDDIVEKVVDEKSGTAASKDMSDYSESYLSEIQAAVSPREAIELVDELSDYEQDPGYLNWEEDWRNALSMLADSTYQNAVSHRFSELMDGLNDFIEIAESNGEIHWEPQGPEFPTGVLEWSPALDRKRQAWEKKRERLEEEWPVRLEKEVRRAVEAFIGQEKP